MATFNFNLPEINQETLSDSRNIKAIYDALYMLNEQLRFTLSNLSIDENFDDQTEGVINKVAREIHLYAKKGELSAELSLEDGLITLNGNRIVIDSDNFKVTQNGTIKAVNGEFSGTISGTGIQSIATGIGMLQILGGYLYSYGISNGVNATIKDGVITCGIGNNYLQSGLSYANLYINDNVNYHYTNLTPQSGYIDGQTIMTAANVNGYVTHPESDFRLKKDIITAPDKWLDILKDVKVKEFTFKDKTVWGDKRQRHLGVIAQQVDKVLEEHDAKETELVFRRPVLDTQKLDTIEYTHGEDPLAVDYNQFIPMLIMGYQRQQEQIEKQQEQIEALKKEIEILKGGKEQ